jgi:hypothetical protein
MFLVADMMTWCEVGEAFCRKAATFGGRERSPEFMKATARVFAREAAEKVYCNALKVAYGCGENMEELAQRLNQLELGQAMAGHLKDMDMIATELVL